MGSARLVRPTLDSLPMTFRDPEAPRRPLMYACASGHEEVVRVLLDAGADVELHNENGHSTLMEAASAGNVSIARQLVDSNKQ